MRRYRKGQFFRPPTAGESAGIADAVEANRRRPAAKQSRMNRGDKMLVKTPPDGIAAREGLAIHSEICTRLVEPTVLIDKTLIETDEQVQVFNMETTDIPGDAYVQTGLTLDGTRCVESAGSGDHIPVELDGTLALYGSVAVTLLNAVGVRLTTTETAYDILGFYEGEDGDRGWCVRLSDGKLKFVSLSCDPPGDGPAQEAADELPPETFGSPEPDPDPLLESSSDITLDAFGAFGSPQNF